MEIELIYHQEPTSTLYCGHAIDVLRELPAESVDCVITSPPYWGLRSYKTEPIIWDNHRDCGHEWGNELDGRRKRSDHDIRDSLSKEATKSASAFNSTGGNFCLKCGAWKGELGLEPTIELYISHLLSIFDEVKRVLKKTGSIWVNIGDSYSGSGCGTNDYRTEASRSINKSDVMFTKTPPQQRLKDIPPKSLCLIPERFALGMVNRGWILRNNIIWYKPNPMPESVKDRFTGSYEVVYFFTKSRRYFFEQQFEAHESPLITKRTWGHKYDDYNNTRESRSTDAGIMNELGRNKRDVWEINTQPYPEAHFATFPEKLVETPILSGCPQDGVVLDPFAGSGTTGAVAKRLGRKYIGIDVSEAYCKLAVKRLQRISIPLELNV